MIEVISAGLYSSFQDMGRYGYRKYGVPVSGAMDRYSARLANHLVGNNPNDAVLEITLTGPVLKFNESLEIAITGAGFSPSTSISEIPLNQRILIPANSVLKFGLAAYGFRAYMAISSGINTEMKLSSSSMYKSVTSQYVIQKGDAISANRPYESQDRASASVKEDMEHFSAKEIWAVPGPEFNQLSELQQEKLFDSEFIVTSKSNRMAYVLAHSEGLTAAEIVTSPTQPGTVQLTPSGELIVLMRDAQTTGGYARVLQLTEKGINRIAQKRGEDIICFRKP